MAPPDQSSGATPTPGPLKTTTEMPCTSCGHDEEPMPQHHVHEHTLSSNTSFSSPTASLYSSASTNYQLPASNKLSCESIPYAGSGPDDDDLGKFPSFDSTSSYESFFHIEEEAALDDSDIGIIIGHDETATAADNNTEFLDFQPSSTTRPPAVQTMMPPQKSRQRATTAAYDPKRLPSSMFRTRPTNPGAGWSATSNESLFSIQHSSNAADLNERYADDFYYDAAGFPQFPSLGRNDAAALKLKQLPSLTEESSGRSGGLCVRHDCARCVSGSKTRKSVRFAATESVVSVSGEGKHSVVVSTLEVEMEETEAPAASATKDAPSAGWCELGCCLGSSSSPTAWWPRFCGCHGCGCHCKWWF